MGLVAAPKRREASLLPSWVHLKRAFILPFSKAAIVLWALRCGADAILFAAESPKRQGYLWSCNSSKAVCWTLRPSGRQAGRQAGSCNPLLFHLTAGSDMINIVTDSINESLFIISWMRECGGLSLSLSLYPFFSCTNKNQEHLLFLQIKEDMSRFCTFIFNEFWEKAGVNTHASIHIRAVFVHTPHACHLACEESEENKISSNLQQ